MDRESLEVIAKNSKMAAFVKGDDWQMLKDIFTRRMMDLQSILNIDGVDPIEIAQKIAVRREVVLELKAIIEEVEGMAAQDENEKEVKLFEHEFIVYEER